MSIASQIKALEDQGRLRAYKPRSRNPAKRRLYLSETAVRDLEDRNSATNLLGMRGPIEAAMTLWTTGGLVYASRNSRFLRRLDPPPEEVWEIRVTEPNAQVRLFGRFAEMDTLIINRFRTRNFLGSKGSQNWIDTMNESVGVWNSLFPYDQPLTGSTIDVYISENYDVFPI